MVIIALLFAILWKVKKWVLIACLLFICQEQKLELPASPPKSSSKKDQMNIWFDVGIFKGTSCIVSCYHLPQENAQGTIEVS